MAELTNLESKIAEVFGLAQAAQQATKKVAGLVEDDDVKQTLEQMHDEAAETERRCADLAGKLDGKKTKIEEKARETKSEAQEMMQAYLGDDADGLDGFEFLVMAEAGELGHVEIVRKMNEEAGNAQVRELVEWAIPVQQRHVELTREGALKLAGEEDPNETE
jgi:rubrerythrin